MTRDDLTRIRKAAAPHMSQAAFARALGYKDPRAYRRYENGGRPVPPRLASLMLMVSAHGLAYVQQFIEGN